MTFSALPLSPAASDPPARRPGPPGDLAIWVFILAELLAFALLFILYGVARSRHRELFDAMQLTLDRRAGVLNTLLLISASACVAQGVAAIRREARRVSLRWQWAALFCGAGFLVVKSLEYRAKFAAGVDLDTNLFYMFYLSLTLFHFLHVVLGMVILGFVCWRTHRGAYSAAQHDGMETGASYWHMVDLVWIVLFPLLYLMR
ncbi:MAG: cytochrome c oxidase subunit 3 family protein [Zoogloea sp.]|uniref:cytochrome c oxidase subunit 3 family protein n=1 Tax=Zoogloea sp. TaxID=49181 RepID=UPI003F316FD3